LVTKVNTFSLLDIATPKHLKAECVIPNHRINQMPVRCWCGKTNEKEKRGSKKLFTTFGYFLTRLNNSSSICQKAKVDDWVKKTLKKKSSIFFLTQFEFFSRFHYYHVDREEENLIERNRKRGSDDKKKNSEDASALCGKLDDAN